MCTTYSARLSPPGLGCEGGNGWTRSPTTAPGFSANTRPGSGFTSLGALGLLRSRAPGRHRHPGRCRRHRLHPSSPTMAEELSAATSYTEDDFYCPVCQEVLKTPVRTAACQHVFCRKCFLTAMRESGIHCPLCRGNVTRRERACPERALDLENIMRKFSGSCRCCAKQIKFYRMRHHYKSCKKYQDEYGVSSIIPNFQISQDSVGNRRVLFVCLFLGEILARLLEILLVI
ncbi:E3 ubiquitin-protein ligase RNF138 isoform X3 [Bos mutus]|uniref:E3 ubiquitin-protein ligase RNF138 isoform X3 n=1 Tax=Bos mutus TaxID=72004 RepID=UPI0038B53877